MSVADKVLPIVDPSDGDEEESLNPPRKSRGGESQITSDSHEVIVNLCEKLSMTLAFITKHGNRGKADDLNEAFALCASSLIDASFVKGMLHALIKGKDE